MKRARMKIAVAVATAGVLGVGTVAMASAGGGDQRERLTGYEEVPALSTPGVGEFRASISRSSDEIRYRLTFSDLETDATQAHIHFENRTNNGPIVVFLCTNLGNGPAGTQACPPAGGTIRGTITPADVGAGAAAQGLAAGEFDEFVRAIQSGATYVNVHSVGRPGGEIRAQLENDDD
jgi:CHRD domain